MFFKILKVYWKLSSIQKRFIKNGGMEAEMPIAKWVKLLEPICHFDEISDPARRAPVGCAAFMFFTLFFGFIGLFVSILIDNFYPFIALIILTLIRILYMRILRRTDVNNNIREVIYPLLQMLALEGGHNQKVYLKINFNKKLTKKERVEFIKAGNCKTSLFEYEALLAKCELIDKTIFSLKVLDTVRRRNITKRSANKTKYKTKYKLKRRIGLSLTFNGDCYEINNLKRKSATIFKQKKSNITYKHTIKQAFNQKTALLNIHEILEKAYLPYSYLIAK